MASKRFFMVIDGNTVVGEGYVIDGPTRANNTAVNAGAAIAAALGIDIVAGVRVGKTERSSEFRPALKDKVKDGEARFKAVAV